MCLEEVFSEEKFNSIIEVMPDVVTVWKVALMDVEHERYIAPYRETPYEAGAMELNDVGTGNPNSDWVDKRFNAKENYLLFFHFWVNKNFVLEELNNWLEKYADEVRRFSDMLKGNYQIEIYSGGSVRYKISTDIKFLVQPPRLIQCVVHKSWITTIGRQGGGLAVVAKKAIFPKYPEVVADSSFFFNDLEFHRKYMTLGHAEASRLFNSIGQPKPMEAALASLSL